METGREEKSGHNVSGTGRRARAADEADGGRVWDAVMLHAWRLLDRGVGKGIVCIDSIGKNGMDRPSPSSSTNEPVIQCL